MKEPDFMDLKRQRIDSTFPLIIKILISEVYLLPDNNATNF